MCIQDSRLTQLEPAVPEDDWDDGAVSEEEETEEGEGSGEDESEEDEAEPVNNDFEQAFGSGEEEDD